MTTLKDWIRESLDKTLPNGFDWDYVVEDDGDVATMEGEPTGNFHYLVARTTEEDNDIYLYSFDNILDAKDFIKEEAADGNCMANGGRGGPDTDSVWSILDLVERKIIDVIQRTTIEFEERK